MPASPSEPSGSNFHDMNTTDSLRQAAQLSLWLDTLKAQLRAELEQQLISQNLTLQQIEDRLAQQNACIEKLIEVMLTTAEMLRQRLDNPSSTS